MVTASDVRGLDLVVDGEKDYRADEGKIIRSEDIDFLSVPTERPYGVKRLEDYSGITFFSLGPLYRALNIDFDILETFAADTEMGEFEHHVLHFKHPIIDGLGAWSFILEGIPNAVALTLFRYLDTQTVVRRQQGLYSSFLKREVALIDPIGVDSRDVVAGETPARVTVFLPSTNRVLIDLIPVPGPPRERVQLRKMPPLAPAVKEGEAVLSTGGTQ